MKTPKKLKIKVTDDDIELGQQCSLCFCAIARAVSRATGADHVSVCKEGVELFYTPDGEDVSYALTKDAARFIDAFDTDKSLCKPTEFTLCRRM